MNMIIELSQKEVAIVCGGMFANNTTNTTSNSQEQELPPSKYPREFAIPILVVGGVILLGGCIFVGVMGCIDACVAIKKYCCSRNKISPSLPS
jgi:hypothetical protein